MTGSSVNACLVYCLVGFSLVVAMVWTMLSKKALSSFERGLDKFQKKKYQKLVLQRRNNAMIGAALGGALAVGIAMYYKKDIADISMACIIAATVVLSSIVYYMLMAPKQSIADYLSPEQYPDWLSAHKTMVRNFGAGLIIGVAAFFLLGLGGQGILEETCPSLGGTSA
jgi:hypothetical protein